MKVRDLMTPNPTCAAPDTTVEEIATLMKEEDIGCVPIVDEDGQVTGVVTDRDIVIRCIAEGKDPSECHAEDIHSPQSVTIDPNADSKQAARMMADRQIRRLPVVEHGRLVGMLSLGDVAVKQDDDRLSGDVLQGVSEGVKSSSDASGMGAHQGGSHSRVKTSAVEEVHDDARPSAPFESGEVSPGGGRASSESRRHEKVLPFREQQGGRARPTARGRDSSNKKVS